jgi:drug/metabolite transporter superfamily protein YnfA
MKVTEGILTRDEMVQVNNVFNTGVPMIYVFLADPHAWHAFAHVQISSWLALGTIAILVYTIGSTTQMALIRSMGVGVYSSYSGVRVLGSVLLSSWILKEPVQNWLEWLGLTITTTTMTVYTIISSTHKEDKEPRSHHHLSKETNVSLSTQDDEVNETSDSFGSTASENELVELLPNRIPMSTQSDMV